MHACGVLLACTTSVRKCNIVIVSNILLCRAASAARLSLFINHSCVWSSRCGYRPLWCGHVCRGSRARRPAATYPYPHIYPPPCFFFFFFIAGLLLLLLLLLAEHTFYKSSSLPRLVGNGAPTTTILPPLHTLPPSKKFYHHYSARR